MAINIALDMGDKKSYYTKIRGKAGRILKPLGIRQWRGNREQCYKHCRYMYIDSDKELIVIDYTEERAQRFFIDHDYEIIDISWMKKL